MGHSITTWTRRAEYRWSGESSLLVTVVYKMSIIVNFREVCGPNWVRFGPRSY